MNVVRFVFKFTTMPTNDIGQAALGMLPHAAGETGQIKVFIPAMQNNACNEQRIFRILAALYIAW